MTIQKLMFDQWVVVPHTELECGDYVIAAGKCFILSKPPVIDTKTGNIVLTPVKPEDLPPVKIMFGEGGDYTTMVMDYILSDLITFGDGTAIIADMESGNPNIFTPRLTKPELEEFCKKNIDHYISYFNQNENAIESGEYVPFNRFW